MCGWMGYPSGDQRSRYGELRRKLIVSTSPKPVASRIHVPPYWPMPSGPSMTTGSSGRRSFSGGATLFFQIRENRRFMLRRDMLVTINRRRVRGSKSAERRRRHPRSAATCMAAPSGKFRANKKSGQPQPRRTRGCDHHQHQKVSQSPPHSCGLRSALMGGILAKGEEIARTGIARVQRLFLAANYFLPRPVLRERAGERVYFCFRTGHGEPSPRSSPLSTREREKRLGIVLLHHFGDRRLSPKVLCRCPNTTTVPAAITTALPGSMTRSMTIRIGNFTTS